MEVKVTEFTPEEPTESLPIVEEPTLEGEIAPETPPAEVTPEPPQEPAPKTVDWQTEYQKEVDHRRNLEKLTGKWANDIGNMRAEIRQQFQVPKPQETYDPEAERQKFEQDPRNYVRSVVPAPEAAIQPLLNELDSLKFRIAHPDYFEGDKLKPEIMATVNELESEEPWLLNLPAGTVFKAIAPLIRLKEVEKGMAEGIRASAQQLVDQQAKTNLAKKKGQLAPTGGTKYEKPYKDMTVEEMEATFPHSDRPLGQTFST